MLDAYDLLERALSDTSPVTIHPRSRLWFEEHALNLVLAVQGMDRCAPDSFIWRYHRDLYVLSVEALEGALGLAGASRVVARIEAAVKSQGVYLARR